MERGIRAERLPGRMIEDQITPAEPYVVDSFEVFYRDQWQRIYRAAGDIGDEELRVAVEPLPTDRLFLVTLDDGDLIVRLRDRMAHVFGRSCVFVDSVDLPPDWPTTCLE